MPDSLLQSKFYSPRIASRLVYRTSLVDRLNERRYVPVTLISAPAGYGKSTLALQWLQSGKDDFVWLSLDEHDRTLGAVAQYIVGALRRASPDIGQRMLELLRSPKLPGAERLADMLLGDLEALVTPLFLVIDDYHTVRGQELQRFMTRFLHRVPDDLHVVLVTRIDPPLDLSRLRGQGWLQEVRGADLRFTNEEAAELLGQISGRAPLPETVALLTEGTEGWPLGLRMAAVSLRDSADMHAFAQRFAADGSRAITDYLLSEVLSNLSDDQRFLLLRTAIVERFCTPLVDVLLDGPLVKRSSHELIESLWSSNFFLVALDDQGVWFRYHHLFRQLVAQELQRSHSIEEIANLHLLAAEWLEQAGAIEDAINHTLLAGQPVRAARVVERHIHEPINREQWRVAEQWVALLPKETRHRPGLLATQAMLEQFRMNARAMRPLVEEAERALVDNAYAYSPAEREAWSGVISTIRASGFIGSNSPQDMLAYAEHALSSMDLSATYVFSLAELWQLSAMQMEGRAYEAIQLAKEKLARSTGPLDARTMRLQLGLCSVYFDEADVGGLHVSASDYLDMAARADKVLSKGWAHFSLGWCAYQVDDLQGAIGHFVEAIDNRFIIYVGAAVDCFAGLVYSEMALGDLVAAKATIDALREFLVEQELVALLPIADSLALRLDSKRGPVTITDNQIAGMASHIESQMAGIWEVPALTAARLEIATGHPQAAEKILTACRSFASTRNNKRKLIDIGILETLLHESRGQREPALDVLRETLLLAESGGVLRSFVDGGSELVPLLCQLASEGFAEQYIARIVGDVDEGAEPALEPLASPFQTATNPKAIILMGELTNREMDVLLLLCDRLSNKEIAAQLYISPRTVKKHTISLYQKLEVNGRRQAAVRARELGLIS